MQRTIQRPTYRCEEYGGNLRILLIGAGALGSAFAAACSGEKTLLRASGVVIDPDVVEVHNLATSRLFMGHFMKEGTAVLGQAKSRLVADQLGGSMPEGWTARRCEVADLGWAEMRDFDLLVSCTDNVLARVETAYAARSLELPVLDGGVYASPEPGGRVSWFPPGLDAACFLCGLPEQRRAELLAYAGAPSLGCRASEPLHMGELAGSLGSLEATAQVMARLAGVYASSRGTDGSPMGEIAWSQHLSASVGQPFEIQQVRLQRSLSCPWHGTFAWPWVPLRASDRFETLLSAMPLSETRWCVQLPWTVCTAARCRGCGAMRQSPERLAALRRSGRCETCQSVGLLEPLACVASIAEGSALAKLSGSQLGLPERHMVQLRPSLLAGAFRGEQG